MFGVCQIDSKVADKRAVFTFKAAEKTRELVFEINGTWTSVVGEQRTDWNPTNGAAFLFLLERSYEDLSRIFAAAEKELGEGALLGSFPFGGITMMGLNDAGEYWMDLALKWMEHPAYSFTPDVLKRVEELAFRKTRNQKLKHRFLKLYAKLKADGLVAEHANLINEKNQPEG